MIKASPVRTNQISGLQTLASIFLMVFLFLVTHEVPFDESLKLCATLLLDTITGALIWILLSKKSEYSVFEFFGVGVALGTSINTVAQLSLRTTPFGSVFNIYFALVVIAIFLWRSNTSLSKFSITKTEPVLLFGLLATALVMICGDRYYLWLGVISFGLSYLLFKKIKEINILRANDNFAFLCICVSIFIALFTASLLENNLFGSRSTVSYIGGWDGFIIEANRKSIMNFGPFDNILLSNTKYAYYWFHDAWSGSLTQRARVGDWIVTTQFGLIVSALASLSLLMNIILNHVKNNSHVILILWLVTTLSLIGSPSNILYSGNLSQVIAVLWICWILFLLDEYATSRTSLPLWILIFAGNLLVMTKITSAVPVITGVLLVAGTSLLVERQPKEFLKIGFFGSLTLASSLLAYVIFIKPAPAQRAKYSDFNFEINNKVFGISTGFLWIDFLALATPIFAVSLLLLRARGKSHLLITFLSSISFLSLILSVSMDFNGDSPNRYLLIPFTICFALVAGIEISQKLQNEQKSSLRINRLVYITGIAIGGICGFCSSLYLHYWNFNFVLIPIRTTIVSTFPILVVTFLSIVLSRLNLLRKMKIDSHLFLAIALVASMSGSFVAHSLRSPLSQIINSKNGWDPPLEDTQQKYAQLKPAMQFLERNTSLLDVIASNSTTDQGFIPASTGVRSFATSYLPNFWGGVEDRYIRQSSFGFNGSFADYRFLRQGCVTWFYVDKTEPKMNKRLWEPFAKIRYEDEFGAVLELSQLVKLPSSC